MNASEFFSYLLNKSGHNPTSLATELAKQGNEAVDQSILHRLKSGKTKEPKRHNVRPIADFYGVDIEAFYDPAIAAGEAARLSRSAGLSDLPVSTVNLSSDTKTILAPVVEWASLESNLYRDNNEISVGRYEAVPSGSPQTTKWVEVDLDMPRFMISRGDLILVTPVTDDKLCKDLKQYVFRTVSGAHILAQFRRLANGYEAIPDSGPPIDSERHGVRVVAIKHGHIEA